MPQKKQPVNQRYYGALKEKRDMLAAMANKDKAMTPDTAEGLESLHRMMIMAGGGDINLPVEAKPPSVKKKAVK